MDSSWALALTLTGAAALSCLYLYYTASSFDCWEPPEHLPPNVTLLYPPNKTDTPSDCNRWGTVDPHIPNRFSSSLVFAQVPKTGTVTLSHMLRNVSVDNGWKWFTTADYRNGMEGNNKRVYSSLVFRFSFVLVGPVIAYFTSKV